MQTMSVRRILTPNRACVVVTTAVAVTCLHMVISLFTEERQCSRCVLSRILSGPLSMDDPELLSWIRTQIHGPSRVPYNLQYQLSGLLMEPTVKNNTVYSPSQEFILEKVEEIFKNDKPERLFFVEAGAFDGEFLSNTLSLEIDRWNGLLVEANPLFFKELLTKNRRAYAINACLATKPWPSLERFAQVVGATDTNHLVSGRIKDEAARELFERKTNQGSSHLINYNRWANKAKPLPTDEEFDVQCLPLHLILKVLGKRHVDFLSLDVEGAELDILKTVPWETFSFSVMAIEYDDVDELTSYLEKKGYTRYDSHNFDHIFVNNNRFLVVSDSTEATTRIRGSV